MNLITHPVTDDIEATSDTVYRVQLPDGKWVYLDLERVGMQSFPIPIPPHEEIERIRQTNPETAAMFEARADGSLVRQQRQEVAEAFRDGDVGRFLMSLDNVFALGHVVANMSPLRRRGILEPCLVWAYTSTRTNNCGIPSSEIERAFRGCDRKRLREEGDDLPADGQLTIYRGVAGPRATRRVRGLSWTLDLDRACWFAARLYLDDPAIYSAKVRPDEVFFYTDGRGEQEVVARPRACQRLDFHCEEIERRRALCAARRS